jgi:putative DNA primase/helicase
LTDPPDKFDALTALDLLLELLTEFPFVSIVDKAVALSGMITPVVRGAIKTAPMHAATASTPGTGKSYLVDVCSHIATGRPCPVIAVADNDA